MYIHIARCFFQILYHIAHKLAVYMSLTILQFIHFDNNDEIQKMYLCSLCLKYLNKYLSNEMMTSLETDIG